MTARGTQCRGIHPAIAKRPSNKLHLGRLHSNICQRTQKIRNGPFCLISFSIILQSSDKNSQAKRKSITGIERKKPVNKTPQVRSPTADISNAASDRAGSIALGPEVTPGKRTLISIQSSRRMAQEGYIKKSGTLTRLIQSDSDIY